MTSLRSRVLIARLRLLRRKRDFADLDQLYKSIQKSQQPGNEVPPARIYRELHVRERKVNGWPCYTLTSDTPTSSKHVMYLHGGAYVHQIQRDHWLFAERLIKRTGCTVTVPIYPLAPDNTYEQTVPHVLAVYDRILASHDPADQIVMGDSAGGALALVIAETLEADGRQHPKELVLISPWLDVRVPYRSQPELDPDDPYLAVAGLREAGRLYAGSLDRTDSVVSPIHGPLPVLERVSVFIGTRDVLLADARALRELARGRGIELDYYEYEGMFHAWVLAGVPESKRALEQIARIVERPGGTQAAPHAEQTGGKADRGRR